MLRGEGGREDTDVPVWSFLFGCLRLALFVEMLSLVLWRAILTVTAFTHTVSGRNLPRSSFTSSSSSPSSSMMAASTNATFFNSASTPGADPYTFYDAPTGRYWAYSTEGNQDGWHFAVYSSPDLNDWTAEAPGAGRACDANNKGGCIGGWARDWW